MKKALITGVSGFVGSHLAEYLIAKRIKVLGITFPGQESTNLNAVIKKIEIKPCNLLHKKNLKKIIKEGGYFDYVFHLAAYSSPQKSFLNPKETLENNLYGELHLLESIKDLNIKAKILIVGSSDEYGKIKGKNIKINEETQLNPESPYAISKVAQDLLGYQYFIHFNMKIVRVRPFNHIGPRQSTVFVVPAFASQIARLEIQGGGTLKVGNLNSWRDFTDVRDICRAYLLALDKGKMGDVYNLGSGKAYKIVDILDILISYSNSIIKIKIDPTLFRKNDTQSVVCNPEKFNMQTGWEPRIEMSKTLFDTINYERRRLNR